FSDKNFYFLTIADAPGKRLGQSENITGSFPAIQEFEDFAFYENEKFNLLKSGREWFGEQFDNTLEATIQFNINGILPNTPITFTSHVMAQSITDCSFKVLFNNTELLTQPIAAVPNSTYAIKGRKVGDTLLINSNNVQAHSRSAQEIKYVFNKGGPGLSVGYLNFFLFSFKRALAQYGDITFFLSSASLSNTISNFIVGNTSSATVVWDISDPHNPKAQPTLFNGTQSSFSVNTQKLRRFVVFNTDKVAAPAFESSLKNQNLQAMTPPNLLIIAHPSFETEAKRLAAHRNSVSGISATVVTTEMIYNEYAGGKQDFTALRDFIRDLYKKPGSSLQNVLLFGRGSYDYKSRVPNNTNFVPIYESVNSLGPLETYSSDDYYALLDDDEGEWLENPVQNSTMNIGIGRLPVKTVSEAKNIVDKLIVYDTESRQSGAWHKNFLFVADDGDFNIHQSQADQLANLVETSNPEFDIRKLYLDTFNQIQLNTGVISPDCAKAIDLAVRKGYGIVNYTGHGNERLWMDERTLTDQVITGWKNLPELPLFVTATCEFGRNDDPFIVSGGERILLQPKGGGIGLVTTARPVNSSTNFTLNRAFYQSFFNKANNQFRDLGSILRDTKNNSLSGVGNRNFSLLGDPSMKLYQGDLQATIDEVKTSSGSTTLKGLSTVSIKGQIKSGGNIATNFSGDVDFTLFDHPSTVVTKGNENPPFTFSQRTNVLFNGSASVKNGTFQANFILPQNVPSTPAAGKLSVHAFSKNGLEAMGYANNFLIGGQELAPPVDSTPPQIQLFMGDTTFVASGLVAPNTRLVAQLRDESGINTSTLNPDKGLWITLDNKFKFVVNDYYTSAKDNFTKGSLIFPIDTLAKGRHSISLSASDTYNNTAEATLEFIVSDGSQLAINEVANYPNPVVDSTRFWFTHNRPGEDLSIKAIIYSLSGEAVFEEQYFVPESQYQVILPSWDAVAPDGRKLGQGMYVV
ncbi:MAG: type IX secretion system sortase PorU, partial [Flammeovirgaceae bacterium]